MHDANPRVFHFFKLRRWWLPCGFALGFSLMGLAASGGDAVPKSFAEFKKSAAGEEGTWDTLIRQDGKEVVRIENARPVFFNPAGDGLLLLDAAAGFEVTEGMLVPAAFRRFKYLPADPAHSTAVLSRRSRCLSSPGLHPCASDRIAPGHSKTPRSRTPCCRSPRHP